MVNVFAFRVLPSGRDERQIKCHDELSPWGNSVVWRGSKPQLNGTGVWRRGQTGQTQRFGGGTAEGTLLLRHLWFSHVRQETGVSGATLGVVHSSLCEAKFSVYGIPDLEGVGVLLAIVLPPADRA